MTTTTRPRYAKQPRVQGLVDERYDVLVAGRKIGEVIRNKHRVWNAHLVTTPAPATFAEWEAGRRALSLAYVHGSAARSRAAAAAALIAAA